MNVIETVIEAKQMPHEVEWIELKTNFWNPKEIGEYISALSNSATIHAINRFKKTKYFRFLRKCWL